MDLLPISPQDLHRLSSGRWLLPILAAMDSEPGSRFGALGRRLGVSRSILSGSLDKLERFGWIVRNSGHGHPLRPEYLLTHAGKPVAAWSARTAELRSSMMLEPSRLGRWSLPLLFELVPAERRFAALQGALAPITPRALSLTLKQLQSDQLVEARGIVPARPSYALAPRGRVFTESLLQA